MIAKPSLTSGHASRFASIALALLLALGALPGRADAANAGPDAAAPAVVQSFYDALLAAMQNARALGERGRYDKLSPVIARTFAISEMTRLAVGPTWSSLSADQQQRAIDAFGRYITATYADRFDSYAGEAFRVIAERPSKFGTIVQTQIVKSNGAPVDINYLMQRDDQGWQVEDVYLTGTISEIATRRSEFSSILRRHGVEGLIAMLNRKADNIVNAANS